MANEISQQLPEMDGEDSIFTMKFTVNSTFCSVAVKIRNPNPKHSDELHNIVKGLYIYLQEYKTNCCFWSSKKKRKKKDSERRS